MTDKRFLKPLGLQRTLNTPDTSPCFIGKVIEGLEIVGYGNKYTDATVPTLTTPIIHQKNSDTYWMMDTVFPLTNTSYKSICEAEFKYLVSSNEITQIDPIVELKEDYVLYVDIHHQCHYDHYAATKSRLTSWSCEYYSKAVEYFNQDDLISADKWVSHAISADVELLDNWVLKGAIRTIQRKQGHVELLAHLISYKCDKDKFTTLINQFIERNRNK